ncbi:MAG: 16S rRNA (uracil(1498)-N(3))-methyltransferase [Alphaproteobacteria bacterium]|nr:16S rRNA (uracil(1498)-N(3))-methyltransferase [Alphaproteobacteria bacterium]
MSGSIRLFVSAPLAEGVEVQATPGQAHYLGTVMRRATGAPVRLFNGADGEWQARLTVIKRDRAVLAVETPLRAQAAEPDLWLAFAVLKRDATDLVAQKATELGVSALVPVITERTNAERVNATRIIAIATEAAEQSERLTVPRVAPLQRLPDLLVHWPAGRTLFAAIERAGAAPLRPRQGGSAAALLVGPEGGFSERELDALRARPFVVPVSLGPRILRAETASIVGLALLQAGD